jgi:hypothetical protein
VRLHERDARALERVGNEQLGPLALELQPLEGAGERPHVVAVTARHSPAECLDLALEVAEIADLGDERVGLQLVVVHDRGDLAEAAVRGRAERLPELALLELAVAGQDEHAGVPALEPVGAREAPGLRDAHAERARAGGHLGRLNHVRMSGQTAEAAQVVEVLERQRPRPDQDRVERRRVVTLAREVAVRLAQDLQVEPRQDLHAAEAGADVSGARTRDHVERVHAAGVGEGGRSLDGIGVRRPDSFELVERQIMQAHRAAASRCGATCTVGSDAAEASARSKSSG